MSRFENGNRSVSSHSTRGSPAAPNRSIASIGPPGTVRSNSASRPSATSAETAPSGTAGADGIGVPAGPYMTTGVSSAGWLCAVSPQLRSTRTAGSSAATRRPARERALMETFMPGTVARLPGGVKARAHANRAPRPLAPRPWNRNTPVAMKHTIRGFVAALALLAAQAAFGLPDLGGRTVVAVTGNDYVPLNFVDPKTGEAVGWEYDAVNEICRRLNCAVDWQVTAWDAMIEAVRSGQFDVGMDGITITEERAERVDFSIPYLTSQQFMLVRADEERFTTPEEVAADEDLLIGSQAGTTNFYVAVYDILDGNEDNPRIKLFDTFGAAVQALIIGDVDLVLMDAASSRGYIGANPDALKTVGEALGTEDFGFIFTPGSDLREPFDEAIRELAEEGFLEALNVKWFFEYSP